MIDFLKHLFLESLFSLLLLEAVVLAVALAVARRRENGRRVLLVTGVVLGGLIALSIGIKTDREQLHDAVEVLAAAVDEGDMGAIEAGLAAGFNYRGMNRDEFIAEVRDRLQRYSIDEPSIGAFKAEVAGDSAKVGFPALFDWRQGERVERRAMSFWTLSFVRTPDGWRLERLDSGKFGPGGMISLDGAWDY